MTLVTLQWNIGGARIRGVANPADQPSSYSEEGLHYIIDYIKKLGPDIITLQETHSNADYNQTELIATELAYPFYINDTYADSHLDNRYKLGQGVISKFPIKNHSFNLFFNPHFQADWSGERVVSHDKGLTRCTLDIKDINLLLLTLHAIPFRPFNVDPLSTKAKELREDMSAKIRNSSPLMLLQGDFNYNGRSLKKFIPDVFDSGTKEATQVAPTTPKGRYYDHVAYRGIDLIKTGSDDKALTDHYPLVSTFRLGS